MGVDDTSNVDRWETRSFDFAQDDTREVRDFDGAGGKAMLGLVVEIVAMGGSKKENPPHR